MSETLSKHRSSHLDQALEDSFPASDPVSVTNPSIGVKALSAGHNPRKSNSVLEEARELLDLEYRPVHR